MFRFAMLACDHGEIRERTMTNFPAGLRITLALGLLALAVATAPVQADRYIVEPIVDAIETDGEAGFSQAELDQLLAPIALYPDALLSKVLIAATYPLEIVEAARWSRRNPHLQGERAVEAVADRNWDPSVKALVAFPDLLERLDEDLDWTRRLGDAMLYQEAQVMDSVQFLRARADAAGSLASNEYTQVIREEKTIIIQPTQTRVVHVPYYDPYIVYGSWWRPAYPPVVWAAPAHYYYGYPGFYWSSGVHISSGFFFSSFYWPQRSVYIVHTPRYYYPHRYHSPHYVPGTRWKHSPVHRRGVAYRQAEVRERYWGPNANPERPDRRSRDSRSGGEYSPGLAGRAQSAVRGTDGRRDQPSGRTGLAGAFSGGSGGDAEQRDERERDGNRARPERADLERRIGETRGADATRGTRSTGRSVDRSASPAPTGLSSAFQGRAPVATSRAQATGRAETSARAPAASRAQQAVRGQQPARQADAPQAVAPQQPRGMSSRARDTVQRSSPAPAAEAAPAPQSRGTSRGASQGSTRSDAGASQRARAAMGRESRESD
jgi:hypothetical protein